MLINRLIIPVWISSDNPVREEFAPNNAGQRAGRSLRCQPGSSVFSMCLSTTTLRSAIIFGAQPLVLRWN
jgi:hypothetical protein